MLDALKLHHDALVIDALVYHCDGEVADLRAGGVDALNITTCHFEADFPQACAEIARWHGIIQRPNSRWLLVETAADLQHARTHNRVGIIMGMQNVSRLPRRKSPPRAGPHLDCRGCIARNDR